jgi:hypothetical protein
MDWITKHTWKSDKSWFWVREVWHFFGGVCIGMVGNLVRPYWVTFSLFGGMLFILLIKEINEDRNTQKRFKTVIDLLAWTLGFWAVSWAKFI